MSSGRWSDPARHQAFAHGGGAEVASREGDGARVVHVDGAGFEGAAFRPGSDPAESARYSSDRALSVWWRDREQSELGLADAAKTIVLQSHASAAHDQVLLVASPLSTGSMKELMNVAARPTVR